MERDAGLLPDDAQIPYRRGMLHYLLGNPLAARSAFEKACELEPKSYDNWLALALICEAEQEWDRAYEALGHMYELRPKDRAIRDIFERIQQARAAEEAENPAKAAADAPAG